MRNTLAGLSALVILFAILGGARNWYVVGGLPAEPGRFAFRVEFDAVKVGTDVTDALRFVHSKVSKPSDESTKDEAKEKKDKETK
jgi:hypothetical protein